MRLLITGGSGLLGSKITSIAVQKGYKTYSGYNKHEAMNGTPIKFDICNKKAVSKCFEKIKPEAVVHAAALTTVDKCEVEIELARKVNIKGTKNILDASENYRAFLVYISSDYVFSGEKGMYKETDRPKPINYYGLTKLEGEKIINSSSIDFCIVRPSLIFDPKPTPRRINFALWLLKKLEERRRIKIITDQIFSPILNTNLSEMVLEIIERRLDGIYHLAGATPITRYEFATLIAENFQLEKSLITPIKLHEMKWIAKRPKNCSLNIKKAATKLRNNPLQIKDAINEFRKELKSQE